MKEEVLNCLTWLANRVSTTTEYSNWTDDFCRREMREAKDMFDKSIKKHIDWDNLTVKDCEELRFGQWGDDIPNLWLIPLYLLSVLPIGTELTSINGDKVIYDGSNIDNDIRFGCIAYGIIVE